MSKIRIIVPKGEVFDAKKLVRGLANGMDALAEGIRTDFDVTTQTWDHQPAFEISKLNAVDRAIGTDDQIYKFVNDGTKEHDITSRSGGLLAFQVGYRAKTRPAVIKSVRGGKFGGVAYARVVHHPGTDPRNFAQHIRNKWIRYSQATVQRAIDAELGGA